MKPLFGGRTARPAFAVAHDGETPKAPVRPSGMVTSDRPQPVLRPSPSLAWEIDRQTFNARWTQEARAADPERELRKQAFKTARGELPVTRRDFQTAVHQPPKEKIMEQDNGSSRKSGADQAEQKQPATVLRDGNIKASIWRNESETGAFYATSFARTYRDEKGEFHDTNSFVAADLLKLAELARAAYARTNVLSRKDREEAQTRDEGKDDRRAAFKDQRDNGAARDKPGERNR